MAENNKTLWDHCDPTTLPTPQIIAVKLSVKGERSLRQKHPWIFDKNIIKTNKSPRAGDVGVVFSHRNNKAIGVGLLDPKSPIFLKILHSGGGIKIDRDFFHTVIQQAIERRADLSDVTNAMRLVFGENDGLPGLIIDEYNSVLVLKVYSLMWLPYIRQIQEVLIALRAPKAVVLRANRHVSRSLKLATEHQAVLTYGDLPDPEIEFHEYGVRFLAHVLKGHKTGFFLDHRYNRNRVGQLSSGKRMLDVFAYAGGFGVHALVNGATHVTSLDISAHALSLAQKNAALNEYRGAHEILCGDAFTILNELIERGVTYDLVVIDPPSFANSADGVDLALGKYTALATLGAQLVANKGWLILASCSSRVDMNQFLESHKNSAIMQENMAFSLVETTGHDMDHTVRFEHGNYLKTAYYKRQ